MMRRLKEEQTTLQLTQNARRMCNASAQRLKDAGNRLFKARVLSRDVVFNYQKGDIAGAQQNWVRLLKTRQEVKDSVNDITVVLSDMGKARQDLVKVEGFARDIINKTNANKALKGEERIFIEEKSVYALAAKITAALDLNTQRCNAIKEHLEEVTSLLQIPPAFGKYAIQVAEAIGNDLEQAWPWLSAAQKTLEIIDSNMFIVGFNEVFDLTKRLKSAVN